MENPEQENNEIPKKIVPRAWGMTLFAFILLITPQVIMEFSAEGIDARRSSIILTLVLAALALFMFILLVYFSWELWTKSGKYRVLSIKDLFSIGEKNCGVGQMIFWFLSIVFLSLAAYGAILGALS